MENIFKIRQSETLPMEVTGIPWIKLCSSSTAGPTGSVLNVGLKADQSGEEQFSGLLPFVSDL